jgi:hypothetical protein
MRLNFQAVVPTFNRRRPISQDGKRFVLPRTVPGAGTSKHATIESIRAKLLSISVQFSCMHRALGRFKLRPGRYHTVLHVTPQRHQQPPRHGHNADAAHALAAAGEALLKP